MKKMKGIGLGWTLNITLAAVFFASLIGVIADQVWLGNQGNVTGAASVVFGLTVLIVVLLFFRKLARR